MKLSPKGTTEVLYQKAAGDLLVVMAALKPIKILVASALVLGTMAFA